MRFGKEDVLASLADGLYITDLDRRIVYWNTSAERITGWKAEDVVGRRCLDQILCHVDKDGNQLCAEDSCPLYRAMVTGIRSLSEVVVFARSASGHRVPMRVTTSPLRNAAGETIGGVETFRDITHEYRDLERAQRAQMMALTHPDILDPRIAIRDRYLPRDIVGGDFHAMTQVDADKVAFWIGDVMGHGIAAALYTMQLRCLWGEFSELMDHPEAFVYAVNERLIELKGADESFATMMFGLCDLGKHEITLVSAGGPPPVRFHSDGALDPELPLSGVPLGVVAGMPFEAVTLATAPGDTMLFFTDGATEFDRPGNGPLGRDGLEEVLRDVGYPGPDATLAAIGQALLSASGSVRLPDDVTLLEVKLGGGLLRPAL